MTTPRARTAALERQVAKLPDPGDDPNLDAWVRILRSCGGAEIAAWSLVDAPGWGDIPRLDHRSEHYEPAVLWLLAQADPPRPRAPLQGEDEWRRPHEWAVDTLARALACVHGAFPLPRKDQPCHLYRRPERRDALSPEFGVVNSRRPEPHECATCFARPKEQIQRRFWLWLKSCADRAAAATQPPTTASESPGEPAA